tara:strand:- start:6338 stop:7057 length:720 start_codon:yes stop_codon:yes gene_type:complete
MGALDQVTQMKNQGIPENQIRDNLMQQGVTPQQITDALAQSQIKSAVSGEVPTPQAEGMQHSIMDQENLPPPEQVPPQQQAFAGATQDVSQTPPQNDFYQPAAYPPQQYTQGAEAYPQDNYYEEYSDGGTNTDTMIEISEQVFAEKTQKLQKQIREISEFKTLSETKMKHMEEKVKRMEKIIDKLQIDVLKKIGSYGDNLQSIKKEMSMMGDSFGKMMKKTSSSSPEKKTTKRKTSKKK